ncbi:MAG: hypothetical protein J6Z17_02010 [Treponema sp.]|nr:hypothetical protein [Treponema sp.]
MKRILVLLAASLITATVFAQSASGGGVESLDSYVDTKTVSKTVEDKYGSYHPKANNVTIEYEYTPLTGEVRFYYTCLSASFDQGEAMNTAMAFFEDFAGEQSYKHYAYKAKDKTKYFKDGPVRKTTYVSYVMFTR